MSEPRNQTRRRVARDKARIPADSIFFEKVVPALLIGLAIVTVVLIGVAAGVLLGLTPFR